MIDLKLQIVLLIGMAIYFLLLVYLLKKKQLTTKYTLFWIMAGVLMLVVVVFPQLLVFFSGLIGVDIPANALFAIIFFCIFMILMFLTATVSKLNDRVTKLTQSLAVLEARVRELEKSQDGTTAEKEEETV